MLAAAGLTALLGGCAVGPDYVRPTATVPAAYKEAGNWKPARPQDEAPRGKWWAVLGDPLLNRLEARLDVSNQNLAQAEAQYRQAQALTAAARAGYFPTLGAGVSATRSDSILRSAGGSVSAGPTNSLSLSFDAGWEPDLWGRIRRLVEAGRANAQASAADLAAARLSAQAALAQDYFQLRGLDSQQRLLRETVADYRKSLQIVRNQYASGVAAEAAVAQAETQLKTAQAQEIDLGVQRAQLEHAIAVLIGVPASTFSIAPAPLAARPPEIPPGVPSQLLERRPDIAAAERRVAAANAEIGVARSAFFPLATLSGSVGFESSSLSHWLSLPNRVWSVGPALAETLFDGGLRRAQSAQAQAAYDATVAAYRQTVLGAFQEVEDNLAALRILADEARVQGEALQAARRAVTLTRNQYQAGTVSYLSVVTVQAAALGSEVAAVNIQSRRMVASVLLIKALGGAWGPPAASGQSEAETTRKGGL